jgi:filamentous hemagglutinin family protein
MAATVSCCFSPLSAFANPTGPTVVQGTANIVPAGPVLNITNTPNAIINWRGFSIGAGETTRFLQQSATSAVLNRVVTPHNPSAILGTLQSNGRVFLINPSGILFGPGSQVDVAGLVASSLKLSNEDFLAGRLRFANTPGARAVSNFGSITAAEGGQVYLVGPEVTNGGIITSPRGEVLLAAGRSVELVDPATPNLRVEIVARNNQAVNLGEVIADAGRVGIFGGLVRNSGRLQADVATYGEHGEILLRATRHVTQDAVGVIQARTFGGADISLTAVDISAGRDIRLNGNIDAGEGRIDLTAGGNIRFESTEAGAASVGGIVVTLRTTTPGKTITQAPDARIFNTDAWGGMQVFANGDVLLPGLNGIHSLSARVDAGGNLKLNNYWLLFPTVQEAVLTGGGSLELNYASFALSIFGNVQARRVTINNSLPDLLGDIHIGSFSTVSSSGPLSISAAGSVITSGAITGGGPVSVKAGGDLALFAGSAEDGSYGLIHGRSVNLTVGGSLRLLDHGAGSWARIQTLSAGTPINLSFPNLAGGGYFVNGVEGLVQDGMTGFFSGTLPAVPGQTLLINYGLQP